METTEISLLIGVLQNAKVVKFKNGPVEIEFSQNAYPDPVIETLKEITGANEIKNGIDEDNLLFAST